MYAHTNARPLFRTPEGRERIHALYDAVIRRWPVQPESRLISTRCGQTHLLVAGRVDAAPLVLIHGQGDAAFAWGPVVGALASAFRLYAVDVIGEPGKSKPYRPPRESHAYTEWLSDVLDGMGLAVVNLMGISFGGFLTLKMAMERPDRVKRAVLLAPAGLAPMRWRFIARTLPLLLFPSRERCRRVLRMISAPSVPVSEESVEWLWAVVRHFRPAGLPPLFAESDLQRVTVPTLLLAGVCDPFFRLETLAKRARQTPGLVAVEKVAGAGHTMVSDQPVVVADRALRFLLETPGK